MLRISLFLAALVAAPVAQADVHRDICESQAREASNYWGGRIPELRIGPFTGRISGSVALGVSRSSGNRSAITMPGHAGTVPGQAGAYARERHEAEKSDRYKEIFDRCMAGR